MSEARDQNFDEIIAGLGRIQVGMEELCSVANYMNQAAVLAKEELEDKVSKRNLENICAVTAYIMHNAAQGEERVRELQRRKKRDDERFRELER